MEKYVSDNDDEEISRESKLVREKVASTMTNEREEVELDNTKMSSFIIMPNMKAFI